MLGQSRLIPVTHAIGAYPSDNGICTLVHSIDISKLRLQPNEYYKRARCHKTQESKEEKVSHASVQPWAKHNHKKGEENVDQ
jgi:hypothetical protein